MQLRDLLDVVTAVARVSIAVQSATPGDVAVAMYASSFPKRSIHLGN